MADLSPNKLQQPKPSVAKLSKRPLIIVGVVVTVLAIALVSGIISPKKKKALPQEEKIEVPMPQSSGLVDPSSIAPPAPPTPPPAPPKEDKPEAAPKGPAPNPTLDAQRQQLLQEKEQVRHYKLQQELQALQAPLSVGANPSGGTRQPGQVEPQADQNRLQTANVSLPAAPTVPADQQGQYDPSERKDKEAFLDKRSAQNDWRLPYTRTAGAPCELKTGTLIPYIMLTGINSDLPGKVIAQVSENVYDTATGSILLIPQGARPFGVYDSHVAMGQKRILMAWNRITFPDGTSVTLESMPAADSAGYSGHSDQVDNHYLQIFGSAMLMSMVTGGMAYSMDALRGNNNTSSNSNQAPTVQDEMGTAVASQIGQTSLALLQRNISVSPTLMIRPGFRGIIVVTKDIVFDRPYKPMR